LKLEIHPGGKRENIAAEAQVVCEQRDAVAELEETQVFRLGEIGMDYDDVSKLFARLQVGLADTFVKPVMRWPESSQAMLRSEFLNIFIIGHYPRR